MGNLCIRCCSEKISDICEKQKTSEKKFIIKLPHGLKSIEYLNHNKSFIEYNDINIWLKNLYINSSWNNWIVYNDQTDNLNIKHTTRGHCKGIITWNDTHISWLCHSVPNFPREFNGNSISDIEKGEHLYGQSFQYIKVNYDKDILQNILIQLSIMEPNIFIEMYQVDNYSYSIISESNNISSNEVSYTIRKLIISDDIIHIAKSPNYHIDIYGDYILKEYKYNWNIETWIRGHKIEQTDENNNDTHNISDISNIKFNNIEYNEKQDHSKWAVSDNNLYWVGDLNRMSSQFKRGGGGFIINDLDLSNALNKLIESKVESKNTQVIHTEQISVEVH